MMDAKYKAAKKLEQELMDSGKIIAGGFAGFKMMVIPKGAPERQIEDMRMAFYGGAHHVFVSMMNAMDDNEEPTEQDYKRLELMHAELDKFIHEFEMKYIKPAGQA